MSERLPPEIAAAFAPDAPLAAVEALGRGLIHRTLLARHDVSGKPLRLVYQRIQRAVFQQPEPLMQNLWRICEHRRARCAARGESSLEPLRSVRGALLQADASGEPWRCFRAIAGAQTLTRIETPAQAQRAALAFARYVDDLRDLPGPALVETLPAFHDLASRRAAFQSALAEDPIGRAAPFRAGLDRLLEIDRRFEAAQREIGGDELPLRAVHHDCKIENLLFDTAGARVLCVLDLDTTMPGRIDSDFGELVRTAASTAPEDAVELERVDVDLVRFGSLATGYLRGTGHFLEAAELRALPLAGARMALMNALRFATDHLQGDVYFRVEHPLHNRDRAANQTRLAERLLALRPALYAAVEGAADEAESTGVMR